MEVQRITGHKTLSMLLRYTQMNVDRIVDRLDATESAAAASQAGVLRAAENRSGGAKLPHNVVRFNPRRGAHRR